MSKIPTANQKAFLLELKELMIKYDASFSAGFTGDTHGIESESIGIVICNTDIELNDSSYFEVEHIDNILNGV